MHVILSGYSPAFVFVVTAMMVMLHSINLQLVPQMGKDTCLLEGTGVVEGIG